MSLLAHPDAEKVAEYRRKTIEASILAVKSNDELMRSSWQAIAQSYQDMADRLERQFKS
jgi:hypothetical protein